MTDSDPWLLSLHLTERDMRAVAGGTLPRWMPREARRALRWLDDGLGKGMRRVMRNRRRKEKRSAE